VDDGELIATFNTGSSSLRFALFDAAPAGEPVAVLRGAVEGLAGGSAPRWRLRTGPGTAPAPLHDVRDPATAVGVVLDWLAAHGYTDRIVAAGHRVVHGGDRMGPAVADDGLLGELAALTPLAPLHQPQGLAGIRAVRRRLPRCPQIACFDTAFHRTLPDRARCFALPELPGGERPRRYGFHGLSYAHLARTLLRDAPAARRVVAAHLGSGASMSALHDGASLDTTMGMTPLDGLPMGTRCGALDPGVVLWLIEAHGYDAAALGHLLYRRSGLLGLSGSSADMRELLADPAPGARLAVDVFTFQCAKALAALTVSLGGLDAVAFTGGIGEHAPAIRQAIARDCAWLGLDLDPAANEANARLVSSADSRIAVWVIPSDEELEIARETRDHLR
jgi:acetate kinase